VITNAKGQHFLLSNLKKENIPGLSSELTELYQIRVEPRQFLLYEDLGNSLTHSAELYLYNYMAAFFTDWSFIGQMAKFSMRIHQRPFPSKKNGRNPEADGISPPHLTILCFYMLQTQQLPEYKRITFFCISVK
jgi:hypothetical protein